MPTRRQKRINELLEQELQLLIPERLDDPRLGPIAVTRVESTQDLAHAKVYFTCRGEEDECAESVAALEQAAGFLRAELATLGLRRLPQLVFARDRQFESGERVLAILRGLDPPDDDSATDPDTATDAEAEGPEV
jgi:ribosome-binding factor A